MSIEPPRVPAKEDPDARSTSSSFFTGAALALALASAPPPPGMPYRPSSSVKSTETPGTFSPLGGRVHQETRALRDASESPAIALLESWIREDSGYDADTWPEIAQALEEDRLSSRKLF